MVIVVLIAVATHSPGISRQKDLFAGRHDTSVSHNLKAVSSHIEPADYDYTRECVLPRVCLTLKNELKD